MKKIRILPKRLLGAIVTVTILCALLVSGTFALFTDTVNLTGNTVQSGTVKISAALTLSDDSGMFLGTAEAEGNKVVISNMAPMDKAVYKLTIKSDSTISILTRVYALINDANLLNALKITFNYDTVNGIAVVPLENTDAATQNLVDFGWSLTPMAPSAEKSVYITIEMLASAGNEFMEKILSFDISVYGVQTNARENVSFVNSLAELNAATTPNIVLQNNIIVDEAIEIRTKSNINFDGKIIKGKSVKLIDDNFNGKILFENGSIEATEGNIELHYPLATGTLQNMLLTVPTNSQAIKGSFSANTLVIGENVKFVTANSAEVALLEVASNMTVRVQHNDTVVKIKVPSGSLKVKIVDERITVEEIEMPQIIVDVGSDTADVEVINNKDTSEEIVIEGDGKVDVAVDEKPLYWIDAADTSWYDNSPSNAMDYEISSAKQLAGLTQLVNNGIKFSGKTITITNDIDLANRLWTPIGKDATYLFGGNFYGGNKLISNLKIEMSDSSNVGLFGYAMNIKVKDIVIKDALVNGGALNVGALLGYAQNFTMENIVAENITVNGAKFVGGLIGYSYGSVNTVLLKNIIVNGDENLGAVAGYGGEGDFVISNIVADDIKMWAIDKSKTSKDVGGLYGSIFTSYTFFNCHVTNGDIIGYKTPKASGVFGSIFPISSSDKVLMYQNVTFQGTINGEESNVIGTDAYGLFIGYASHEAVLAGVGSGFGSVAASLNKAYNGDYLKILIQGNVEVNESLKISNILPMFSKFDVPTLTINSGVVLEIEDITVLNIFKEITNNGTIVLTNNKTISVATNILTTTKLINNGEFSVINNGTITSTLTLFNKTFECNNAPKFTNKGTLASVTVECNADVTNDIVATMTTVSLKGQSTLTNNGAISGKISVAATAVGTIITNNADATMAAIDLSAQSTLTNNGTILGTISVANSVASQGTKIVNNGTISVAAGAAISTIGGTNNTNSTVENNGTIESANNSKSEITQTVNFLTGAFSLTNNGVIRYVNDGEFGLKITLTIGSTTVIFDGNAIEVINKAEKKFGVLTINIRSNITNNGTIAGTLTVGATAAGTTVTNNVEATMAAVTLNGQSTLTNNGTISGTISVASSMASQGTKIVNNGTISVAAGAAISTIGGTNNTNSTVENNGTIESANNSESEITSNLNFLTGTFSLTNNGTISYVNNGNFRSNILFIIGSTTVIFDGNAIEVINKAEKKFGVLTINIRSNITNNGTIAGTLTVAATAAGTIVTNNVGATMAAVALSGQSTLTNYDTISGAISVPNSVASQGTVIVNNGTVSVAAGTALSIGGAINNNSTVENNGTIKSANNSESEITSNLSFLTGTFSLTNNDNGTISYVNNGTFRAVNSLTIGAATITLIGKAIEVTNESEKKFGIVAINIRSNITNNGTIAGTLTVGATAVGTIITNNADATMAALTVSGESTITNSGVINGIVTFNKNTLLLGNGKIDNKVTLVKDVVLTIGGNIEVTVTGIISVTSNASATIIIEAGSSLIISTSSNFYAADSSVAASPESGKTYKFVKVTTLFGWKEQAVI